MIFNPNPKTVTMVSDTIVLLGEYEIIKELEKEV
jgi:K+/H+ antiporter YhaU regulatory subunit KhtT